MLTLLRAPECYCPQYAGKKDILLAGGKIYKILPPGSIADSPLIEKTVYCDGMLAFPGLVDQHVHIAGGGGEKGFASRVPEIALEDIIMAGVTTVVGLLGADSRTRSMENLLAKARSLETGGITTWIYSGSYSVPVVTLTGSIQGDLVLIDKVIGTGEIAISDHRSSQPSMDELQKLSSDTHLGGLIGGKAGVVHIHVGDGKAGLGPLIEMISHSDLPPEQFIPTHLNRSMALFHQAMEYCRNGGRIDLTAGETNGLPVPYAIKKLMENGVDLSKVTVSSDANGSMPEGGVTRMASLYDDIRQCIEDFFVPAADAFALVTENAAKNLKIFPRKGSLGEGGDADILITDKNLHIKKLICMGKLLVDGGKLVNRKM